MLIVLLLLLTSCGSPSRDTLKLRMQQQIDQVARRLLQIESYEELRASLPLLKGEFNEIAETTILLLTSYPQETHVIHDELYHQAVEQIATIEGGEALLQEAMRPGRERLFSSLQIGFSDKVE